MWVMYGYAHRERVDVTLMPHHHRLDNLAHEELHRRHQHEHSDGIACA